MSRHGEIRLPFGDQERTFRLGIGQWVRVQEKCDAGPEQIAARLGVGVLALEQKLGIQKAALAGVVGAWRLHDVREVIYQGLLGGDPDLSPIEAGKLMLDLVDQRPLRQNLSLAFAIVMVSLDGVPEDPVAPGEGDGGTASADSPPANTASATSTAGAGESA